MLVSSIYMENPVNHDYLGGGGGALLAPRIYLFENSEHLFSYPRKFSFTMIHL